METKFVKAIPTWGFVSQVHVRQLKIAPKFYEMHQVTWITVYWLRSEMDLLLRQLGRNMATEDQHHPKPRNNHSVSVTCDRYSKDAQPSLTPRPGHTASDKYVWEQG